MYRENKKNTCGAKRNITSVPSVKALALISGPRRP